MTTTVFTLNQHLSVLLRQAAALDGSTPEAACLWEMPKDPSFGDLSNAVSFKLASQRKQPPHRIAEEL